MPAPIRSRSKIALIKHEGTYGVDAEPTGAANAMLMTDVSIVPMEGQDVSRGIERPYRGAQEEFKTGLHGILTGSTELIGEGHTGIAPLWSPMARACGLSEVVTPDVPAVEDPPSAFVPGNVAYAPATDENDSATLYFWIGGTRHRLLGARGNAVVNVAAQGIPKIQWSLTGLWTPPTEVSPDLPDLSGWVKPKVATNINTPVFTVGGVPLVMRSFSFNLGNDVQPRQLIGRDEIMIVDSAEEISCVVEAVPLGTFDPFARGLELTNTPVAITHDTRNGHKVSIAAPKASVKRLASYENDQGVLMWPLRITPLPDAGDDQFTITLT